MLKLQSIVDTPFSVLIPGIRVYDFPPRGIVEVEDEAIAKSIVYDDRRVVEVKEEPVVAPKK